MTKQQGEEDYPKQEDNTPAVSDGVTELAALVQVTTEASTTSKPKNLFAQNAENELIKETQKLNWWSLR